MEKQKLQKQSISCKNLEETGNHTKSFVPETIKNDTPKKSNRINLDNSMFPMNISRAESTDDSFLEMERMCRFEEQVEEANANGTMLFDIEPPSELWNQSFMMPTTKETICENKENEDLQKQTIVEEAEDGDEEEESREESIELSPFEMVALTRPSTIIEETSSQCISTANQTEESNKSSTIDSTQSSSKSLNSTGSYRSFLQNSNSFQEKSHKRETLVFKHRKFFTDEDEQLIFSPSASDRKTKKLISLTPVQEKKDLMRFDENVSNPQSQFNNTLEEVEYFMDQEKKNLQQTPLAFRDKNVSIQQTPLFSCKRSRIITEMATREILPIPKRGPLLNFYDSPKGSGNPKK